MALSGAFWGANADPQPAAPAPAPTPQPQGGGGGVGGFIYNNLIKPTVDAAAAVPKDIINTGHALGVAGNSIITGQKGAQLAASKQQALDLIRGTTAGKSLPSTVQGVQQGSVGKELEQETGNAGNQIVNLAAPVAGGEELAGKVGLKALIGAGAKVGAKLGAAGGATNALAQGSSGGDVLGGAAEGAGVGALTGGAGGIVGAGVSRLLGGKAAGDVAATVGKKPNFVNAQATKQAQNVYNDKIMQEFGSGGKTQADNGTPINSVLGQMQNHGIEPGVVNMARYGNAGYGYNDFLNNEVVPQGTPVRLDLGKVIQGAVQSQPAANLPRGFAGNLVSKLSDFLDPEHSNISGLYHPGDLLHAAQELYNMKVTAGDNPTAGVISNLRNSLVNAAGNEGGLNDVIKGTNLPSVSEAMSNDNLNNPLGELPGTGTVQGLLDKAGNNDHLTQEMIDKINNSSTIQGIQKAELPHIAANDIAQSHADAIGQSLPKPTSGGGSYSTTGMGGLSTTYELGSLAHGNVGALLPLGAKAANPISKVAAKFGTPDMTQVGPRVGPDLSNLGNEAPQASPEAGATPTGPPAPEPAPPTGGFAESTFAQSNPHVAAALTPLIHGAGAVANGVSAAANIPTRIGAAATNPQGARTLIGALTGNGAAQAGAGNLNTPTAAPGTMGQVDTSGIDQLGQAAGAAGTDNPQPTIDASSIPGGTLADYEAEVQADPKNAATYKSIYDEAQAQIKASTPAKLNATEAKNLTNIQNAAITLHQYVTSLNSLSSNTRGMGVGALTALLGKTGHGGTNATTAAYLESKKPELAIQIAQAINNGTKPQGAQIKEIESMLPSIGDPKALADQKIQQLAESMSGYLKVATGAGVDNRGSGDTSDILSQLGAQ